MSEKKSPPENQMLAVGSSLALAFGVVLGLLLDNIAMGTALGPALGLAIGVRADPARKRAPKEPEPQNNDG